MEKEPQFNLIPEEKVIDGKKYRRVPTGYTVRQYYSHSTPEKGPGPGWDFKESILERYKVRDPSQLPDEEYFQWELAGD